MNKAMEMMDMIMNGCNIVAVEDVITVIVWKEVVVCAMQSDIGVCNGAGGTWLWHNGTVG